MNDQNNNTFDFSVAVRNLTGITWTERWTKEKLSYFILMADVPQPKFDNSVLQEWVKFDVNRYRWDKQMLLKDEFISFAAAWPGLEPVAFDSSCISAIGFSYKTRSEIFGVGMSPANEPLLVDALVRMSSNRLQYERFNYAAGEDAFLLKLDDSIIAELCGSNELSKAMRRVNKKFYEVLKRRSAQHYHVRFMCRRGSFKPPFQMWFEL